MNKQRINLILIVFIMYFGWGAFFPFISMYFQDSLGFNGVQIGQIFFISGLIVIFSVPSIAYFSDRIKNPNLVYILVTLITFLLFIPLTLFNSFTFILILYVVINGVRSSIIPLLDTIILDFTSRNKSNYGLIRSMGSLAFIISSIIVGYFLDIFTNFPALFIYIHIAFLLMSAILMSKQINTYNMTTTYNRSLLKDLFLLLKDFKFINLILILAISNSIIMVSQSYLSLSILDLHGNSEIVGYSTFFMVIPEVLLFGLAIKLTRRYKHLTLICIGVLSMILRWSLLLITHNLVILLLASFGHGLIMALVIVVGFDLIKKIVDTHLLSSALSFFVSISNLFIAIISLLVGYTIDHFSVQTSYLIYLVFSFFVVILIINYYRIIKT